MRTWLDELTASAGRQHRLLGNNALHNYARQATDYQIMRGLTTNAVVKTIETHQRGVAANYNTEFLSIMAPFFLRPDALRITPYACMVGRDLARRFADATVSSDVARHAESFAKEKRLVYIDVADRAFRLGQSHHLRALFVMLVPRGGRYVGSYATGNYARDASDQLRIFAVFGEIGERAFARACWNIGDELVRGDDAFAAIAHRVHVQAGVQIENIADDVENLMWLALAYASSAEPEVRDAVPMAAHDGHQPQNRAARRRQQQFSLFRIERLRAPADNFGRRVVSGGGTDWQLGRRITVRGHFKMQPHGRRRQMRKLVFVAPHHRGPLDGAPLHVIAQLRAGPDENHLA